MTATATAAVIAIDGPAAAGKGTLARLLAAHYGFAHLDTGTLYRAVALKILQAGQQPDDPEAALAAARQMDPQGRFDPELRRDAVGEAARLVAAQGPVRDEILAFQRRFARQTPGAVLDGRDIATVVCPDAAVKLFVTADPAIRARRRWEERRAMGESVSEADVLAGLHLRDRHDAERPIAPLRQASDAHLIDTSQLTIEEALARAVQISDAITGRRGA